MLTFALNQSAHDILYTVLLPVRKIDTVKARFLYCGMLELFVIVLAVIAALVRMAIHFPMNKAGINITVAYFGFQLMCYSIFNIFFLGNVYKDPLKIGARYFIAVVAYVVLFFICEFPVWNYYGMIEGLVKGGYDLSWSIADALSKRPWYSLENIGHFCTVTDLHGQIRQLPILGAGIIIFILCWILTFRRAARQFEKYDM